MEVRWYLLVLLILALSNDIHAQVVTPIPRPRNQESLPGDPSGPEMEIRKRQQGADGQAQRDEDERERIRERNDTLRLPTPAERERKRMLAFQEFQKDTQRFAEISETLSILEQRPKLNASDIKTVRSKSKDLDKTVSRLSKFLLDGKSPPNVAPGDGERLTAEERLDRLVPVMNSVKDGLRSKTFGPGPSVIDDAQTALIRDLHTLRLINKTLSK